MLEISFRECDWFDLWLWFEFTDVPGTREQQYLEEVLTSWYLLGKLGGFNAGNIQVQETGVDISYFDYDREAAADDFMSVMHNMGEVEYRGTWARCWFDLGTADAIAIDVLLNALRQFAEEYVGLKGVVVGGANDDWPIPTEDHSDDA